MSHVTENSKKSFSILLLFVVTMIVTIVLYQSKATSISSYFSLRDITRHLKLHMDTNTTTGDSEGSIHGLKENKEQQSVFVYSLPGSSLAFQQSSVPQFYYRMGQSYHPSDKHRTHPKLIDSPPDVTMKGNESKLILFYNPPGWYETSVVQNCQEGINTCPITSCKCSNTKTDLKMADAVIVDGVELNMNTPMTKLASQVWILFALESPYYFSTQNYNQEQWRQMFNWTMTYRLDSDIPIPYGFLLHRRVSKNYTAIAEKKTKSAVWLVSNCHTPGRRELYVKELNKYYKVDIFGKCGKETQLDDAGLLNQYRFYLAFENTFCFDYITEKLFKTYSADINIIPVVRGGASYDTILPNGTSINAAHFNSPKELGKYLSDLENNLTAYAEFLQRQDQFIKRTRIQDSFCDICVKIHNAKLYENWYTNIGKWYNDGTCKTPTDYY